MLSGLESNDLCRDALNSRHYDACGRWADIEEAGSGCSGSDHSKQLFSRKCPASKQHFQRLDANFQGQNDRFKQFMARALNNHLALAPLADASHSRPVRA